ncbi:MAG TPA: BlaI/MecI/CopY family transcriptional regulator [Holophaga sp.]|nr:BlaI/MecI/CopY family transcriptional regulator [Holophaga sp.]
MDPAPRITEAEWTIMERLWARHPSTAQEIAADLADARDWSLSTVKTLLNRLVTKGAVGYTRQGREFAYDPLLTEAQARRAESATFLQRVFGGALRPMVASMLEDGAVSAEEIEALRRLLDEKAKAARRRS